MCGSPSSTDSQPAASAVLSGRPLIPAVGRDCQPRGVVPASLLASALWSPLAVEGAGVAVGSLLAEGSLLVDG